MDTQEIIDELKRKKGSYPTMLPPVLIDEIIAELEEKQRMEAILKNIQNLFESARLMSETNS